MAVATSTLVIAGAATTAVGAATSIYAANQNKKNVNATNKANADIAANADATNYARWMESQGIGPDGKPVNTWLPRYFQMEKPGPRTFSKKGTAAANGGQAAKLQPLPDAPVPPMPKVTPSGYGI